MNETTRRDFRRAGGRTLGFAAALALALTFGADGPAFGELTDVQRDLRSTELGSGVKIKETGKGPIAVPEGYPHPDGGTAPVGLRAGDKLAALVNLPSHPEQLTDAEATKILNALNYPKSKLLKNRLVIFQKSYFGPWNVGKACKRGVLDATTKKALVEYFKNYKAALEKYPDATIDDEHPDYKNWVKDATKLLTKVPKTVNKEALLRAISLHESGATHWIDGKPVMGSLGDTGLGQIMPFNSVWLREGGRQLNSFDPADNLKSAAILINDAFAQFKDMGRSLEAYNEGASQVGTGVTPYTISVTKFYNKVVKTLKSIFEFLRGTAERLVA